MLRNGQGIAVGPCLGVLVFLSSLVAFVLPGSHDSGRLDRIVAESARVAVAQGASTDPFLLPSAAHPRVDRIDGQAVRWWVRRDAHGAWTVTAVVRGTTTTRTL